MTEEEQRVHDLSDGDLVDELKGKLSDAQKKIVSYEEDMLKDLNEDETQILYNMAHAGIKAADIYKVKRVCDFMFGFGETPEAQQLHELGLMIHRVKDEIKADLKAKDDAQTKRTEALKEKTEKRVRWLYFSLIGLATGIVSGLDIQVIQEILIELAKIIFT